MPEALRACIHAYVCMNVCMYAKGLSFVMTFRREVSRDCVNVCTRTYMCVYIHVYMPVNAYLCANVTLTFAVLEPPIIGAQVSHQSKSTYTLAHVYMVKHTLLQYSNLPKLLSKVHPHTY